MPSTELDAPKRAVVVDVVRLKVSDPGTFIRQHNAASMQEGGTRWAAMTRAKPRVGDEIELTKAY
jgi:hypothetical protein